MHLLASKHIADQYAAAVNLLEQWSALHVKAMPRRTKVGQTVEILQAPGRPLRYKERLNAAYDISYEQNRN